MSNNWYTVALLIGIILVISAFALPTIISDMIQAQKKRHSRA